MASKEKITQKRIGLGISCRIIGLSMIKDSNDDRLDGCKEESGWIEYQVSERKVFVSLQGSTNHIEIRVFYLTINILTKYSEGCGHNNSLLAIALNYLYIDVRIVSV